MDPQHHLGSIHTRSMALYNETSIRQAVDNGQWLRGLSLTTIVSTWHNEDQERRTTRAHIRVMVERVRVVVESTHACKPSIASTCTCRCVDGKNSNTTWKRRRFPPVRLYAACPNTRMCGKAYLSITRHSPKYLTCCHTKVRVPLLNHRIQFSLLRVLQPYPSPLSHLRLAQRNCHIRRLPSRHDDPRHL